MWGHLRGRLSPAILYRALAGLNGRYGEARNTVRALLHSETLARGVDLPGSPRMAADCALALDLFERVQTRVDVETVDPLASGIEDHLVLIDHP